MATQYSAIVWPPLIFPTPTLIGKIATFTFGPAPPTSLPQTPASSKIAVAAPPTEGPRVIPTAPSASVNFAPAAQAGNSTSYVNWQTTQNAIYSAFGIINGTNVFTGPYST